MYDYVGRFFGVLLGLSAFLILTACGGGSDPFYKQPDGNGGGTSTPIFGTTEPVQRPAITAWPEPVRPPPAGPRILVVYDEPENNPYARLGRGYAIMLQNLIGHFDANVVTIPARQYTLGAVNQYDATFYIGWATGEVVPQAFLQDVAKTEKRVVWLRSNLGQINQLEGFSTADRWGFLTWSNQWFDAEPTAPGEIPGFFSTVYYKNLAFKKSAKMSGDTIAADPELLITEVSDPTRVKVHAVIGNPTTQETAPYVLQSGNFWFVADNPFTYAGTRDRYMVFADLLHDMLGIDHPVSHPAMIRLEDVDAKVVPANFKAVVDLLHANNVPFTMATIPHYKDPYGAQNNGKATEIPLAQATTLRLALDYALTRGGEILQHGYTHQGELMKNGFPGNGATGYDYEFWDVVHDAPMPGDSVPWALGRVQAGLREFLDLGYRPVGWETPHYQGSPSVLKAVAQVHQAAYQRHSYYTSDQPNLTPGIGADFLQYQFFPYLIERDIYGLRVLPENLGNLQYFQFGVEEELTAADVLERARYALAVRDGFGSFFYHPFLVDTPGQRGLQDLQDIVTGLNALGFTWTSPSRLLTP